MGSEVVPEFTAKEAKDKLSKWLEERHSRVVTWHSVAYWEFGDVWGINAKVFSMAPGGLFGNYGFQVYRDRVSQIAHYKDRESDWEGS